jgi:UvrD-like helicase family protein/nuclease-like protein/AAA domain-containing protein
MINPVAEIVPDKLPSRASKGEERLFSILKNLPDDYIVYYEPIIENRYPDFVLICPDLGLMIIEVKGWYPSDIKTADHHEVVVLESRRETRRKHPLRQARDYMFALMDYCKKHPEFHILLNPSGEYQNRFVFPFGNIAILSNITSEQLGSHSLGDLSPVFPPSRVVTRDGLLSWENLNPDELKHTLRSYFDPYWSFPRLTERQVNTLRVIIHPQIQITSARPGLETGQGHAEMLDLKVLDLKQERNALNIGQGHRILYGVAGSGKTVLLVARARLLAQQNPESRVLVLCFNVSLSTYLKQCLADCQNATVLHFDGWAKANGVVRRFNHQHNETNNELGERLLRRLEQGYGDARSYDTVLIDEAQDFAPGWFRCALAAMKETNDGDLLIVGDGSQGLYRGNRAVSWEKLGIHARGRTIHKDCDLDKNYRNTREILELAAAFAAPASTEESDGVLAVGVDPAKALRSTGQRPVLSRTKDRTEECARVLLLVDGLLKGKHGLKGIDGPVQGSEIGILYPRLVKGYRKLFSSFLTSLRKRGSTVWLSDPEDKGAKRRVGELGIKVQTIHSAKGLQYRVVILMWADLLPSGFPDSDAEQERRLMYVALTRPEDMLFITCSGNSSFIGDIRNTGKVDLA